MTSGHKGHLTLLSLESDIVRALDYIYFNSIKGLDRCKARRTFKGGKRLKLTDLCKIFMLLSLVN